MLWAFVLVVQLVEVLTQLARLEEAAKLVSDAMHQFTGTAEEVSVLIANAQISLKRGKVDAALRMLGNIPFDSPSYPRAQTFKADIHLKVCCCAPVLSVCHRAEAGTPACVQ
jgi:tetratricopeptide repeat protein 21B